MTIPEKGLRYFRGQHSPVHPKADQYLNIKREANVRFWPTPAIQLEDFKIPVHRKVDGNSQPKGEKRKGNFE